MANINIKEISRKKELFTGGHRLCAGCGAGIVARQVLMAVDRPVVVTNATGCLEVSSTIVPYTAWEVPWFHSAFENAAAASASGIEAAYRSLRRQGRITADILFIVFGGDGGTYDIGLQSLSGAMERGHRLLYVCYNNQAYMNTGIQRSGATPQGAHTTTAPVGQVRPGKEQTSKDLTAIMAAHDLPYVAQASISYWNDFITKVQKALNTDEPTFINVLQPCRLGWGYDPADTLELARLAVETCAWPVYEVVGGNYRITRKPREKKPLTEFLKRQSRFRHLFSAENRPFLESLQADVDRKWEKLKELEARG